MGLFFCLERANKPLKRLIDGGGFQSVISGIFKGIFFALLAVVLLVGLGIVVPRPLWLDDPARTGRSRQILMLSNPIHTDIAIPVDSDLITRFAFLRSAGLNLDNPNLRYLVFGWGGRSFYTETRTWADLKAGPVLKSFALDRSVIHAELAGDIPLDAPAVTVINIDAAGLEGLKQFILGSFEQADNGPMPLPGSNYGPNDTFFEARGYFNALVGCNTWTAAALRQAGLTSGFWTALPIMLRLSLNLHNEDERFVASQALP
ncbi:TIGR02117 family protein [Rhizobium sp. P40RR-XXII]|uniref:TIGR02117 family protein n=1 Tax=unclassified Rhizobium TaxID=2613769 RepID=UPI001456AFAD|nr:MULTISPECIES: TIGR02117 family protein [unclassified Rhizobium]NLR83793.1 TIGR02117 family protein [Rhizobium sp. P28RR-XV]NLS15562.1 TIGR02117 family protein [Rhizobium sp. P40RR-XXII]